MNVSGMANLQYTLSSGFAASLAILWVLYNVLLIGNFLIYKVVSHIGAVPSDMFIFPHQIPPSFHLQNVLCLVDSIISSLMTPIMFLPPVDWRNLHPVDGFDFFGVISHIHSLINLIILSLLNPQSSLFTILKVLLLPFSLKNGCNVCIVNDSKNQLTDGQDIVINIIRMMDRQSEYPPTKTVKVLLSQIQNAFIKEDQNQLYQLLRQLYRDPAFNKNSERWNVSINTSKYSQTQLGVNFAKLLETIKQFQLEKLKKGINYAFKIHLDVLSQVLRLLDFGGEEQNVWICKPMRQIIRNTKRIFMEGCKKDQQNVGVPQVRKDVLFIKLNQFRNRRQLKQSVKKLIIPLVDNMQISIMLQYHSYDQILRMVKNSRIEEQGGKADIDNHYFQRGKTSMIYQNFQDSQSWFELIKIRTRNQKRLVLKYLIPCKMFLGKIFIRDPNNPEQYFPEYDPIIQALRKANFSDYNEAIKKYQKLWIKRGIYLLMDKLRIILWRNLLKKVYNAVKSQKIQISTIHKAVTISGGDQKLQECVCIISNLIYQGYIKGYIFQSEQHKVLVLKKGGDGFPSLSKR